MWEVPFLTKQLTPPLANAVRAVFAQPGAPEHQGVKVLEVHRLPPGARAAGDARKAAALEALVRGSAHLRAVVAA